MSKEYADIEWECKCGADFIWTTGEQKFMDKLLESGKVEKVAQPSRCYECREERKRLREEEDES